ncbi:hypothetical protein [Jeotgalibaca caeni]|uniref:hypothetical protein n=1 Tax=Jeotgalibaca caeni TaxID=3028623 RepID=UPI00237D53ED|nr:hypothetical protein [Jeotgalibaca caeni]MDE1549462.1 hypothetical protein [Jeotgalibaca caeni]
MKKWAQLFMLTGTLISLTSCKKSEGTVEAVGQETEKQVFSYLDALTKAEKTAYERFFKEKNIQALEAFAPEKIIVIYLHSVVIDDVEAIRALTYNDGTLPYLDLFRETYYTKGWSQQEADATLDYRFYDEIKIQDENKTEDSVTAEIQITYGLRTNATLYTLKKQENIWKLDIWQGMAE